MVQEVVVAFVAHVPSLFWDCLSCLVDGFAVASDAELVDET